MTGTSSVAANQFDDEWVLLCDGSTTIMRRYRTVEPGVVTATDFNLDGTSRPFASGAKPCVDAASTVTVLNRRDSQVLVLCDTSGPFLRRFTMNDVGLVVTSDTTLDGVTPYSPVGPVGLCFQGRNPVGVLVSLVASGGSLTTSATARRVTAVFQPQPAAGRDTINGVPLPDTANDTKIVLGDLSVPGFVAPTTFAAFGGRNITVIQEF